MTEQRSEIDNLFQRMSARLAPVATATPETFAPETAAPVTVKHVAPVVASGAADEWPLLAMLNRSRSPRHVHHMMMAVEETPVTLNAPVLEPVLAPEPVVEPTPDVVAPSTLGNSSLSPLEQLFQRAEQTGQAQQIGSVFERERAPQPVTLPPTPSRMAPPPLKTRTTTLPTPTPKPAQAADVPVAIAPRQRDWQPLDNVPSHLFDRVGAR